MDIKENKWLKITPEIWEYLKNVVKVEGTTNGFLTNDPLETPGDEHVDYVERSAGTYTFLHHSRADVLFDEYGYCSAPFWEEENDVEWVVQELNKLADIHLSNIYRDEDGCVKSFKTMGDGCMIYAYRSCQVCGKPVEKLDVRNGMLDRSSARNDEILNAYDYYCSRKCQKEYVINECGGIFAEDGFLYILENIAPYMDDDIRESLHSELAVENPTPEDNQKFYDEYCKRHFKEFGETFSPDNGKIFWVC